MKIIKKALTFDDVLLVPSYSSILPSDVQLNTKLTKEISINIPLVSAAMDTVTESRLAIVMAQEGGIGIIHKNLSPIDQAKEVMKVKRYESGILRDPITINSDMTIRQVLDLSYEHGFSGFPVLHKKEVIGIITNRDLRFEENLYAKVSEKMTPQNKLITIQEPALIEEAKCLMHKYRLERVLIVNDKFELQGLITVKDILKAKKHPNASKDLRGRLLVGAAIGVGKDNEERVHLLTQAGVDVIVVDTAHGHSKIVLNQVKWIKKNYPSIQIIAGNIATTSAAIALIKAGVDAIKVGIGPGSICTTRIVTGVGVPQITAVEDVAKALKNTGIPLIADGGIRYSGDIAKILATGSNSVMIGSIFSGAEETPGEVFLYQSRAYKSYRGMGSVGAMNNGSADRYFQEENTANVSKLVPEGIEGRVSYKGNLSCIIQQLIGGIRSAMGYCGCKTIVELHEKATFVEITSAGMRESHVHDVQITKEAPNYHMDE